MSEYTKEDILRIAEEEDVAFIRLQFTDIFGTLKNMAVTASSLKKALDGRIMFDASSIEGFASIENSDMYLVPDLSTFAIFPWRPQQDKVARLICDVYRTDGTPFAGDPRSILRRAIADAAPRRVAQTRYATASHGAHDPPTPARRAGRGKGPHKAMAPGKLATAYDLTDVEQRTYIEFAQALDSYIVQKYPDLVSRTVVVTADSMEKLLCVSNGCDGHSVLPRS